VDVLERGSEGLLAEQLLDALDLAAEHVVFLLVVGDGELDEERLDLDEEMRIKHSSAWGTLSKSPSKLRGCGTKGRSICRKWRAAMVRTLGLRAGRKVSR